MTRRWVVLWMAAMLAGCGREEKRAQPVQPVAQMAAPVDERPVMVAFGDSLTAGHGAGPGLSYADFLQKELDRKGYRYRVVNQGISGDTTSGGVTRIDAALRLRPKVVILELGANDGLRGLLLKTAATNLAAMVASAKQRGARVLLVGMRLPPNYGSTYAREFQAMYPALAKKNRSPLVPFLFDGMATRPPLFQTDGLHPTAEAQPYLLDNVWRVLAPMLRVAE